MKEISSQTTIRDIDNMFLHLDELDLKLSLKKPQEYRPIELVTILHFLLSHLQQKEIITIYTNTSFEDTQSIQQEFYNYYIIVCSILYRRNIKLKNDKGHFLYVDDLHEKFVSKLKSQEELYVKDLSSNHVHELKARFFSPSSKEKNEEGLSFLIPCFDHLEKEGLSRSSYFYNFNKPKGARDIALWFERLFKFNEVEIGKTTIYYNLSVVINELMQNTHIWARTTYDGEDYIKPNIRACLVNIFLEHKLTYPSSSYDNVQEYLKQVLTSEREEIHSPERQTKLGFIDEKIGVCEISIMDTGPGMGSRWLHKNYDDFTAKEESAAVISCFHKYFTSDNSSRSRLRGRGLSNVVDMIGQSGLLRVRTGRTLLLRNFHQQKVSSIELTSGNLDFPRVEEGLPKINGTTISILYPFFYTLKSNG